MVGRATGIGVMFGYLKRRAVVQQAIEHVWRFMRRRRNDGRMIGAMLIGNMGVKGEAGSTP
jgi:hypothetical protein